MSKIYILLVALCTLCLPVATAQEYSVETIDGAPEADNVSAELLGQFADEGYRIKSGSRSVGEIWFCKNWKTDPDFTPTLDRLYPFSPGQLIGIVHFGRRGSDFRDQSISRGWYTLRFALQPVDGNHVGTSPTRDFLVLIAAEDDEVGKEWDEDELNTASSDAAGSAHPAMLCLQPPQQGEVAVKHNEYSDWWILHAAGTSVQGEKTEKLPIDVVVAGHAAE